MRQSKPRLRASVEGRESQNFSWWAEVALWGSGHGRNQCCSQGQEAMEDPDAPGHPSNWLGPQVWVGGSEMLVGAGMVRKCIRGSLSMMLHCLTL